MFPQPSQSDTGDAIQNVQLPECELIQKPTRNTDAVNVPDGDDYSKRKIVSDVRGVHFIVCRDSPLRSLALRICASANACARRDGQARNLGEAQNGHSKWLEPKGQR